MAPAGVGLRALLPMAGSPHVSPVPLDFSTALAHIHSLTSSPLKLKNTASSITDTLGFKRTGSEFTLFFKQMRRAQLGREEEVRREAGREDRATDGRSPPAPHSGKPSLGVLAHGGGQRLSWCVTCCPSTPVRAHPASFSLYFLCSVWSC